MQYVALLGSQNLQHPLSTILFSLQISKCHTWSLFTWFMDEISPTSKQPLSVSSDGRKGEEMLTVLWRKVKTSSETWGNRASLIVKVGWVAQHLISWLLEWGLGLVSMLWGWNKVKFWALLLSDYHIKQMPGLEGQVYCKLTQSLQLSHDNRAISIQYRNVNWISLCI